MKKLFLLFVAVLSMGLAASAQTRTIKGTVVDATTDERMPGVSVVPLGSARGVNTDIDGNFTIVVNSNVKALTFSFIGYDDVTKPVADNMLVSMTPNAQTLETVVITGYGSGKKLGAVTGSVAVIGQAALENVTTPSFVDALQGKVSGLSVMSNSGDPSSTENAIRLRGINSLNSSTTPLFILDGAPVTQNVFSTLNPNDIESITVLKDAASVAIYGSRAANGVIVITSKRGKYAEKAHVDIRAKYGWSQMTSDKTDMMNAKEYVHYRDLINQPVSDEMRYAAEELGIDTDWRSEFFDGHAPTYSIEAAVSGGTERLNYYLSLNHMDQEGIIAQSSMRRETLRFSITSRVNEWLRVGLQTNLGYTKYQQNNESNAIYSGSGLYTTNPMIASRKAMPMDSPYYYIIGEDGRPQFGEKAEYLHFSQLPTPAYIEKNRSVWSNRATVNASLFEELTPIKGLTIRAQQAIDAYDLRLKNYGYAHGILYTPMGDVYGEDEADENGIITGYNQQSFSRYYQFTYTNTAEYRTKFADSHNLSVLIGEESIIKKSEGFDLFVEGNNDARLPLLSQAASVRIGDLSESYSESVMNSFFIAASYNFAEKYYLDANYRRDGSSFFAPGHRWANFWSLGAKWDAKQENFLKNLTWMDKASVRLSYGTTGNASFANYAYFGLVGSAGLYNGQGSTGIAQVANPELTWETVGGLDAGINVGFCNKVTLDVAFYNKNTSDMILQVPFSMTTGVSAGWGNVAGMRNTGVDIDINYTPINNKNWFWEIRANMNYNHNEITKLYQGLDELVFPSYNFIYRVGKTANEFYMVRYAGVDPRDGQQMWYTREGNLTKVYNEERDAVCIGGKSQYAPIAGGFGTTLSWKGLSLRADFTWAAKKYMVDNDLYFIQNNQFSQEFNQTTEMLNVWTHRGQETNIPKPGQEIQFDTRMLENASFLRLKTLAVQYSLPKKLTKKLYLENLRVHFTGRNLLTFTNYTGYDPEPETNVIAFFYPNTRQYEIGIDVSF